MALDRDKIIGEHGSLKRLKTNIKTAVGLSSTYKAIIYALSAEGAQEAVDTFRNDPDIEVFEYEGNLNDLSGLDSWIRDKVWKWTGDASDTKIPLFVINIFGYGEQSEFDKIMRLLNENRDLLLPNRNVVLLLPSCVQCAEYPDLNSCMSNIVIDE